MRLELDRTVDVAVAVLVGAAILGVLIASDPRVIVRYRATIGEVVCRVGGAIPRLETRKFTALL